MLNHVDSLCGGVEGLRAGSSDEPRRSGVPAQVFPAQRQLVRDRNGVVDICEAVDTGKSGLNSTEQGLEAVARALGLGTEGPIGLSPGRHTRQFVHRRRLERCAGRRLRSLEQGLTPLVARTGLESVDGNQECPVVRSERENISVDRRPGKVGVEILGTGIHS
jgi:hypothetical protein